MVLERRHRSNGNGKPVIPSLSKPGDTTPRLTPERIQYRGAFVPLEHISVLPQGRKTFEHIDQLAEDIADKGLISPPLLARFDREAATDYPREVNKLWHLDLPVGTLKGVTEEDGEHFYVLIAGERRYRAVKSLVTHQCSDCQRRNANGSREDQGCFSTHFPTGFEARICDNISPLDALWRQASENIHNSLLPQEEAIFYDELYRVAREKDPKLSLTEFSRKVGRGEEKVRDALRFCMLPDDIQDQVKGKLVPYGTAIEIARLVEANIPTGDLDYYIKLASAGNMTVGQFNKLVGRYLEIHTPGNIGLFGEGIIGSGNVRQVIDREATRAFWVSIFYIEKVAVLFNEGLLGKEDSPFSHQGPIHALQKYVGSVDKLMPHLVGLLPEQELSIILQKLEIHRAVIEGLNRSYGQPNQQGKLEMPYDN